MPPTSRPNRNDRAAAARGRSKFEDRELDERARQAAAPDDDAQYERAARAKAGDPRSRGQAMAQGRRETDARERARAGRGHADQ
jgi:hypothetical protein